MNSEQSAIKPYTATIAKKEKISAKVYLFELQLTEPASMMFLPGQFISIQIAENVRRSYSIASSPLKTNGIDLVVDIGPGGVGSKFFEQAVVGQTIRFLGPMGKFTLQAETGKIVFLATGTGIAPLKSMIEYLLAKSSAGQLYLNWGFRFEEDMFWKEYFESLPATHPNFHFTLTLSRPQSTWTGKKGYVQDFIDQTTLADPSVTYYVCGGGGMVKGVVAFLEAKGIPHDRIFFEPF